MPLLARIVAILDEQNHLGDCQQRAKHRRRKWLELPSVKIQILAIIFGKVFLQDQLQVYISS